MFTSKRADAQYCSTRCRIYAKRKREITTIVTCETCGHDKEKTFTKQDVLDAVNESVTELLTEINELKKEISILKGSGEQVITRD